MKEIIEKIELSLLDLTESDGGSAVTESDIRDAKLLLQEAIDMLKNL